MEIFLVCLAAVLLDLWWGELRLAHPLVGFGRLAGRLESLLLGHRQAGAEGYLLGAIALLLLVVPLLWLAYRLSLLLYIDVIFEVLILYVALGARSLRDHARNVALALKAGNLEQGRRKVAFMVSRDCRQMDEAAVSRAAVESVLENGNDAVFGALFWFVLAGAPGVVLYRTVNTLDAMWGYRTPRYRTFGWAAARLDDLLNWVPARLTALSYALLGRLPTALRCWRRQGQQWDSPNGGPVMAAGAGSLGISLGGPAVYHGQIKQRPVLGQGPAAGVADIGRAVRLVYKALLLWLLVIGIGGWWFDWP